ncbi:ATP-binding cassette domain-containing protein [Nonomuraea salmonea]|uniref:ATP-binding cassette domain-containing protein n=1 Tax=Nonomuraea salmonea TaxID=46181 RepID=UPI002FEB29D1
MLRLRGIGKSFLGVRVLSGVDLEAKAGEVHAVVGENGAGKSTLMKIICGVHAPDEGVIEVDGRPVSFAHPLEAQRAGIAIIHQEFNLLPERTVAENVFLGREPVRRGLVDRAAMERATAALLDELGETQIGPPAPPSSACRSPSSRSSRSSRRCRCTPGSSSWTSPARRSPSTRSRCSTG